MNEQRRAIWSWAFIDWANSAFATVMMTALFPLFFTSYWCDVEGMTTGRSSLYWGLANGIASALIAVLAPLLGSIADQGNAKRKFLITFTVLGALATASVPMVAHGHYALAAVLYAVAAFAYSGNVTFTDAMMTDIAEPRSYDRVSALGYALGYVGGGLEFLLCVMMLKNPERFGFADRDAAMKASFVLTGVWWLVFTIPAVLWVRETPGTPSVGPGSLLTRGFRQFVGTFKEIRHDSRILFFLGGYILYIDGVNTVIKLAVKFGKDIGLDESGLVLAVLVVQFVAFPAAVAFGRLGEKFGAKRGIMLGIIVYVGVCIFASRMTRLSEFWVLAVVVGLVQGGVQSLSRSYFARLIPAEKGGEYFGFYNMLGKFSAVLGPPLYGVMALLTDVRTAILSLLILFIGGILLLGKVRDEAPVTAAS